MVKSQNPFCAVALAFLAGAAAALVAQSSTLIRDRHPVDPWVEPDALRGLLLGTALLSAIATTVAALGGRIGRAWIVGSIVLTALGFLANILNAIALAGTVGLVGSAASLLGGIGLAYWVAHATYHGFSPGSRAARIRSGFTLVELLVVVAVIALLAGLVVPVYRQSLRQGNMAEATSRLRQVYVGLTLYREAHDDKWPRTVEHAALASKIPSGSLKSRWDTFPDGYGTLMARGFKDRDSYRTLANSLECWLPDDPGFTYLPRLDSNHGIVVDRTPGLFDGTARDPEGPGFRWAYHGPFVRLRLDGSIERANLKRHPSMWRRAWLYTDHPLPPPGQEP